MVVGAWCWLWLVMSLGLAAAAFESSSNDFFYRVAYNTTPGKVTGQENCAVLCRANDSDGYVAWILSAEEHAAAVATITTTPNVTRTLIGANRRMGNQAMWRWTDGPMRNTRHPLGAPFWVGTVGGACIPGSYCNMAYGEPGGATETQLCIESSGLPAEGKWRDFPASYQFSHCLCRHWVDLEPSPFYVVPYSASPGHVNVQDNCQSRCGAVNASGHSAWILNERDHKQALSTLIAAGVTRGILGGNRRTDPQMWRWTTPPMRSLEFPTGTPFYGSANSSGANVEGMFNDFGKGSPRQPDNYMGNQDQLLYWPTIGGGVVWADDVATTSGPCLCRTYFVSTTKTHSSTLSSHATASISFGSMSAISSASISPSTSIAPSSATLSLSASGSKPTSSHSSTLVDSPSPTRSQTSTSSLQRTVSASPQQTTSLTMTRTISNSRFSRTLSVSGSFWNCGAPDRLQNVPDAGLLRSMNASMPIVRLLAGLNDTTPILLPLPLNSSASGGEAANRTLNVTTEPIPRNQLLLTQNVYAWIGTSMSMRWAGAHKWDVSSTLVSVGALTNFAAVKSVIALRNRTIDRHDIVVFLQPPDSATGFLRAGLSAYDASSIYIQVTLSCDAEGGAVGSNGLIVTTTIPAPGNVLTLGTVVAAVSDASQWVTSVGSPGAGSAVSRVSAMMGIALCSPEGSGSGGGMLGIEVGSTGACDGGQATMGRGAIVGNAVLLCSASAILAVCIQVYSSATRRSFAACSRRLMAPSILLPLWIAVLQTSVAGVIEVLSQVGGCWPNVLFAALGVAVCVAPVAWMLYVACRVVPHLGLKVAPIPIPDLPENAPMAARLLRCWNIFQREHSEWMPERNHQSGGAADSTVHPKEHAQRHAGMLLHEFSVLPYAIADYLVLIACSTLSAISGVIANENVCVRSAIAVMALFFVQLVVCAALRPFNAYFGFVHGLVTLLLSFVSAALQLGSMLEAPKNTQESMQLQFRLTKAAALVDLASFGVSGLRVAMDIVSFSKGFAHAVLFLCGAQAVNLRSKTIPEELAQQPTSDNAAHVAPLLQDDSSDSIDLAFDVQLGDCDLDLEESPEARNIEGDVEEVFWDADGNAMVRGEKELVEVTNDDVSPALRLLFSFDIREHSHHSAIYDRIVRCSEECETAMDIDAAPETLNQADIPEDQLEANDEFEDLWLAESGGQCDMYCIPPHSALET